VSLNRCHRRHAPLLGEHNVELLTEIGYSPAEIDDLIRQGVIATEPRP
jgi:crotonobetainyl-CoA:carnitine CoA-transferase CaiB-like acyl-CoA transferase